MGEEICSQGGFQLIRNWVSLIDGVVEDYNAVPTSHLYCLVVVIFRPRS